MGKYEETEVVRRRPASRAPWLLLLLVLLVGGGAVYWLREQLENQTKKTAQAERTIAMKQKTLEETAKARAETESRVGELQNEITELIVANEELKSTSSKIEDQLKQEIARGDIRLSQVEGKLQVELVDKILFDSGDAAISKRGEGVLARVGQVLATITDKQIQVSGHTDNTPISEKLTAQFPTNWELSVARATNVVRFLGEKGGVPESMLSIAGYGPHKPVASNGTPKGRARNRRIEILLTPRIEAVIARK
jgi:chemotaxis protein MotB